jgi:two-component system phosphate regulon sensor histidine kinase PhoR
MRFRFARKIILFYATFIAGIIAFLLIFFNNLMYNAHLSVIKREMDEKITFAEQIIREEGAFEKGIDAIQQSIALCAKITKLRITIVTTNGKVIADSEVPDIPGMENHLYRPEIQDAIEGITGFHIRRSATVNYDTLYCARRSSDYFIRLAKPLHEINDSLRSLRQGVLLAGIILALGSFLLIVIVSRRIAKPVGETGAFAVKFASGDLAQRIMNYADDEIGDVQRSLNSMADTIARTIDNLRAEQEKLHTTFETIPDGIALIASDGRIVFANNAFRHIIDATGDPSGRLHFEVIRSRNLNRTIVELLSNGTALHFEEELSGGRIYEVFLHGVSKGMNSDSALLLLHDITEAKRIERIKTELVGNMSHELKTPITIMRGYLETIQDNLSADHPMRPFIDKALENADRQTSLINDILKLHLMESRKEFPLEPVHLTEIIDGIITLIKPKSTAKEISFSVDYHSLPEKINGSRFLAEEIFFNLIDNAVGYNNVHGSVSIHAESSENRYMIMIDDTGPGIPAEEIERIFERFYRVEKSRSRATGGTGLGLSIVKHACELMGWKITACAIHTGSRFTVEIPAATTDTKEKV